MKYFIIIFFKYLQFRFCFLKVLLNKDQRDKTKQLIDLSMSPMMIHKIIPSVDYSWWLKRLDIQLNEPTKQSSIKVLKFLNQLNKKPS